MSHQLRFSNKENVHDTENVHVAKKQSTTRNSNHRRRPLQGKDLNQSIPTLNKAQSSLYDLKPQGNLLQMPRMPLLQKANSSLGFLEQKLAPSGPSAISSEPFNHSINSHPPIKSLEPQNSLLNVPCIAPVPNKDFISDSLIKRVNALPPLYQTISSTLSTNTHKLHASNVPRQRSSKDPLKAGYTVSRDQLIEELADDPESIETIPVRKHIVEVPDGAATLEKDDLDFFSKSERLLIVDGDNDEYEEQYLTNEEQLTMKELDLDDPEVFGFPGMTKSDLQDLVDDI